MTELTIVWGKWQFLTTLESNLTDIKRDVKDNESRINEAETRIATTEEKLVNTESVLATATGRIANVEAKMDDLENCGRKKNIHIFSLKEGAEGSWPLLDFVHDILPKWLGLEANRSFVLRESIVSWLRQIPTTTELSLSVFSNFKTRSLYYTQRDIQTRIHPGPLSRNHPTKARVQRC